MQEVYLAFSINLLIKIASGNKGENSPDGEGLVCDKNSFSFGDKYSRMKENSCFFEWSERFDGTGNGNHSGRDRRCGVSKL